MPFRVYPGGLSVSRAFGDIFAKNKNLGGNPKVLISKPEITKYRLKNSTDFLFLGCDGIFDKLSSKQLGKTIWHFIRRNGKGKIRKLDFSERIVNHIFNTSMKNLSYDNLTGIFINLNSF